MSKLLMRMRDVPEDEATEIRKMLEGHAIEFFETFAGNWGISMPALWVKDESEFQRARTLLDDYQSARLEAARSELKQQQVLGQANTWKSQFLKQPLHFVAYWVLIVVVLFISIYYFFTM